MTVTQLVEFQRTPGHYVLFESTSETTGEIVRRGNRYYLTCVNIGTGRKSFVACDENGNVDEQWLSDEGMSIVSE